MLIILEKNEVENSKNYLERTINTRLNSKANSWFDNYRTAPPNIIKSDCVGLNFVCSYSKRPHRSQNQLQIIFNFEDVTILNYKRTKIVRAL